MKVSEAKVGEIVEIIDKTLTGPVASGRLYKVARPDPIIGATTCYQRFTRVKVQVHPSNECRIIDPATVDGF